MANALYDTFKRDLQITATFDMDVASAIVAALIDAADYTYSAAHDEFSGGARDVPLAAVVSTAVLPSLTVSSTGVFDSGDFTWTAVTGDQSENIILHDDPSTNDRLVAFYDTGMTGMPVTPNGGNINVTVNASGWYAL